MQKVNETVSYLADLGYRLDKILDGLKLYNEMKGTLDIEEYEQVLDTFEKAMNALEEQLDRYHELVRNLNRLLE